MTKLKTVFGSASVMVLGALVSFGSSGAWADEAAAPTQCSFPCLFRSAQPAPAPQPVAAEAPGVTPEAEAAPTKPAVKPVHRLTIAADAGEMGRLKALAAAVPGLPVKIVKLPSNAQPPATDFTVKAVLQPAGEVSKIHDAKLFTEQLHIIAGSQIASVKDLQDHVVSFGAEGSAGQAAARQAFQALGVTVKETPLDLDNALDGAATGDVDAVVVLAPEPFERLKTVGRSGLHLLSWPENGSLPAGAVAATIAADHYPGLAKPGETIRVVGVDAILSVSAKGAKDPAARKFMNALAQHSATLSKQGFDLLKADLDSRTDRRVASAERR